MVQSDETDIDVYYQKMHKHSKQLSLLYLLNVSFSKIVGKH